MGRISSMLNEITRSLSVKRTTGNSSSSTSPNGREAVEAMARDAKKKELILMNSGMIKGERSHNLTALFSKRGEKGINQDSCIVWEEFGCQEDMTFCGIFDGHGTWGHHVAKRVGHSMPSFLLCNWQQQLAEAAAAAASMNQQEAEEEEEELRRFTLWKRSYLRTCAALDQDLHRHPRIDSFHSGSTALSIVKQGNDVFLANVGDSRAVLGTVSDDGSLTALQLTVDMKPDLPEEAQRINESKGRVFCLKDEPGVHRMWSPHDESPGLSISRAFGDYCMKSFGLISVPQVTHRKISSKDRFIVMATDGVWDVISNQESVAIVAASPEPAKSAKLLVKSAAKAWRRKRKKVAMDDISAIVLFLHSCQQTLPPVK
ncbi:hypothetical protein M569_05582 [Genlisea aurea]|uniref:PPM-type phosphatase domain-containing protein n=1 Tax=Genlisea aurea TaxID=192259 RepID=S8CPR7_9LAMI|nr:hypothetical protein M569_05582 [Genlisea aurea]